MQVKATAQVDLHLSPDGEHTLALADDVALSLTPEVGDVVLATHVFVPRHDEPR